MVNRIYLVFELIAFLAAVLQLKNIKYTQYKYFIPYLLFIILYEYGSIENVFVINHSNLWISNITLFVFFLFYSIFLYGLLQTDTFKKWIKVWIEISILLSILNLAFVQGFWSLNTITILLQFIIIIASTCLYFYELINNTKYKLVIVKLPGFWLNTGLLFFCLAEFLFYSSFTYMAYKKNYEYFVLFSIISNIANAILYSCLTVSFICFSKTKS
jgi:hypothetical protein